MTSGKVALWRKFTERDWWGLSKMLKNLIYDKVCFISYRTTPSEYVFFKIIELISTKLQRVLFKLRKPRLTSFICKWTFTLFLSLFFKTETHFFRERRSNRRLPIDFCGTGIVFVDFGLWAVSVPAAFPEFPSRSSLFEWKPEGYFNGGWSTFLF